MPESILLPRFIGYPVHDLIEERLAGTVHTTEVEVIAGLDRLKASAQQLLLLLCSLLLCPLLF